MTDQTTGPMGAPSGEGTGGSTGPEASWDAGAAGERHASWVSQLQTMIDELATQATPALREIAAKAAELAAKAGDAAGPIAQRAAEVTGDVGHKVAVRGREMAAELRRAAETGPAAEAGPGSMTGGSTATATMERPTPAEDVPPA